MPKRLKRQRDPIQLGKLVVDIATGQVQDAQELGAGLAPCCHTPAPSTRGARNGKKRARAHGCFQLPASAIPLAMEWRERLCNVPYHL
jgi:hypothetical protein